MRLLTLSMPIESHPGPLPNGTPVSAWDSDSWSQVVLSVQRKPEALLITCSPSMEGIKLEGANLEVAPVEWAKGISGAHSFTNGYYVPPAGGARAFRIKLNPTPPGAP